MAEQLAFMRKAGGGGKYTETSLWTNPSPTSGFTSQTVTLSESMDNYKYLKIKYAFSTSLYADANCNEIVIPVADFKKSLSAANGNALIVVGGSSTTTLYTRFVFYPSDTGVQFGHSVQFQTSTTNNNTCIPLEILGLNELDHGEVVMDSGTFTIASGVTDTITCGFKPKKIYIYNYESTSKMFSDIYDENLSSTYTIGAYKSSSGNGCASYALGGGNNGAIQSITSTGFTFKFKELCHHNKNKYQFNNIRRKIKWQDFIYQKYL